MRAPGEGQTDLIVIPIFLYVLHAYNMNIFGYDFM